ncbi:MAG: hypothetical protein GXY36_10130 [Chloroflexi bacterium]|nr:hypothetical protein [Chloroflexota bacterium]
MNDDPVIGFESAEAWTQWLEENHAEVPGVWVKLAKKGSRHTTVSYEDAVKVALCFGWIDGQKRKLDDDYSIQRFTPRRRRSPWSRINRDRAEALIAQGLMRPAGLAEIERAKADGRWDAAYEPPSTATVPDDFQAALDQHPDAQAFFEQLNKTNRFAMIYRITTAKKPETRQKRIAQFIAMLKAGEKLY